MKSIRHLSGDPVRLTKDYCYTIRSRKEKALLQRTNSKHNVETLQRDETQDWDCVAVSGGLKSMRCSVLAKVGPMMTVGDACKLDWFARRFGGWAAIR